MDNRIIQLNISKNVKKKKISTTKKHKAGKELESVMALSYFMR